MKSEDIIPDTNDRAGVRRHTPGLGLLLGFVAAARHQSITRAATELSLTQSAISRQIRALEELTGQPLFFREKQRVRLTPIGESYAGEVRRGLAVITAATLECRGNAGGGVLNLAVLPTFATRWLAPRLARFSAAHPGITLNLTTRLTIFDFDLGGIDMAIHYGSPEWPGADLAYLMAEQVLPVCSPDFRDRYGATSAADLLHVPLVDMLSRPRAWPDWFARQGQAFAARPTIAIDQFATAAQLAMSGQAVALMPRIFVTDELARGTLVSAIEGPPTVSAEAYHLAWPLRRRTYPPAACFRDWIVAEAAAEY